MLESSSENLKNFLRGFLLASLEYFVHVFCSLSVDFCVAGL